MNFTLYPVFFCFIPLVLEYWPSKDFEKMKVSAGIILTLLIVIAILLTTEGPRIEESSPVPLVQPNSGEPLEQQSTQSSLPVQPATKLVIDSTTVSPENSNISVMDLDISSSLQDLEYLAQKVPPVHFYRRPFRPPSNPQNTVRVACLYAGFLRDYFRMQATCREAKSAKYCRDPIRAKYFGNQRQYILTPLDCDIFISTWDIVGAGRFCTKTYDMKKVISPAHVKLVYGEKLAMLHVQNYSEYEILWRQMHRGRRSFPQTKPTKVLINKATGEGSWLGRDETHFFMRQNDYSQAYKHWCVLKLVLNYTEAKYDLFFRLRTDLRVTKIFSPIRQSATNPKEYLFKLMVGDGSADSKTEEELSDAAENSSKPLLSPQPSSASSKSKMQSVHLHRVHVSNFDVADFGFLAPPSIIKEFAKVWHYCLEPASEVIPYVKHNMISEYNLILWRMIFDKKWEVDSGGRYLWVSRRSSGKKGDRCGSS